MQPQTPAPTTDNMYDGCSCLRHNQVTAHRSAEGLDDQCGSDYSMLGAFCAVAGSLDRWPEIDGRLEIEELCESFHFAAVQVCKSYLWPSCFIQ